MPLKIANSTYLVMTMANPNKAISDNVDGNFFVDSTCFNCGLSRHFAPEIFGDNGSYAFVKKQPVSDDELLRTKQALLSCPTASIGMYDKLDLKDARASLPRELTENIYINGYNHRNSYGAHSYFIKSNNGNWLTDAPRFVPDLIRKFEDMGGLKYIFLTHRDDVADAHKYAAHFDAQRIIHFDDRSAQPNAEIILDTTFLEIDKAKIYHAPGHTKGHLVMLWDNQYLFTGDHFAWSQRKASFIAFRRACWYSWTEQIKSVQLMQQFEDVRFVFPGHGMWHHVDKGTFPEIIEDVVQWMKDET